MGTGGPARHPRCPSSLARCTAPCCWPRLMYVLTCVSPHRSPPRASSLLGPSQWAAREALVLAFAAGRARSHARAGPPRVLYCMRWLIAGAGTWRPVRDTRGAIRAPVPRCKGPEPVVAHIYVRARPRSIIVSLYILRRSQLRLRGRESLAILSSAVHDQTRWRRARVSVSLRQQLHRGAGCLCGGRALGRVALHHALEQRLKGAREPRQQRELARADRGELRAFAR